MAEAKLKTAEREVFLPKVQKDVRIHSRFSLKNEHVRCFLSELLGTLVLVTIGCGCVAQTVLGGKLPMARGNIVTINFGWGIAVMMGIYTAGGVSGGHINPAFTLAAAIFKKISWRKVPFYMLGQYAGAFLGACIVYIVYIDAIYHHDPAHFGDGTSDVSAVLTAMQINVSNISSTDKLVPISTMGIFGTFPQEHVGTFQAFLDQIIATSLLVLIVFAIVDPRNMEVPRGVVPIAVGFIIVGLTTAFEYNCGAALNPARDFSPRLFSYLAGWGPKVFSHRGYNWFWVPILGPHIGAVLGASLYTVCIEMHWPLAAQDQLEVNRKDGEKVEERASLKDRL